MDYDTTVNPAGGDGVCLFEVAPPGTGMGAHDIGGDKADPTQSASSAANGRGGL